MWPFPRSKVHFFSCSRCGSKKQYQILAGCRTGATRCSTFLNLMMEQATVGKARLFNLIPRSSNINALGRFGDSHPGIETQLSTVFPPESPTCTHVLEQRSFGLQHTQSECELMFCSGHHYSIADILMLMISYM